MRLTRPHRTARRRRPLGRRWTAVDFAFYAIAGAGAAGRPGRWEDAIEAFAAVVDLHPESVAAREALARLLGRSAPGARAAEA
jgi:hypothetical protein